LAGQRLWGDPGGEPTRCDATCQRKVVPYPDLDTIRHPTPRCSGLGHSAEQRSVKGSPGMSDSSSIFFFKKRKENPKNQQSVSLFVTVFVQKSEKREAKKWKLYAFHGGDTLTIKNQTKKNKTNHFPRFLEYATSQQPQ
jgi:hypothetical protein